MSDVVPSSHHDLEEETPFFEDDSTPSVPARRQLAPTPRTASNADDKELTEEFDFPIGRTQSADPHSTPLPIRQRIEEIYDFLKNGNHFDGPRYESEGIMKHVASYIRGSSGWTFLHQAAFFQNDEAIKCLLKHGADKNIRGRFDGKTPYDVALGNGKAKNDSRVLDLLQLKNAPTGGHPSGAR